MGAEFSDPLKQCCCAKNFSEAQTIGENTNIHFDDYLIQNEHMITKVQALVKQWIYRMRYRKLRDEYRRQNQTHFKPQHMFETASKHANLPISMFSVNADPQELETSLTTRKHRYLSDGAIYEGQWLGGIRHGRGVMKFADGASYEGFWYLGFAHGFGKFTHVAGETYEGEWSHSLRHGKGKEIHKNCYEIEGQWYKNSQDGVGVARWPCGDIFQGNFIGGKKVGYGKMTWAEGGSYEGNWDNDKIIGFGVYIWGKGSKEGCSYTGSMENGRMQGFGIYHYKDGRRYEGFYTRDKRQGYGMYCMGNEENMTYSGAWYEGKQHGYGCTVSQAKDDPKFGIYYHGVKKIRITSEEAGSVQDDLIDLAHQVKNLEGVEDAASFWHDISVLSDKFQPFDNFGQEQQFFELKKQSMDERRQTLFGVLNQLKIAHQK